MIYNLLVADPGSGDTTTLLILVLGVLAIMAFSTDDWSD